MITAKIENSLVCKGCIVHGGVINSILAPGVHVGRGAVIKDSILLPFVKVHTGSRLLRTIVGENSEIMRHCIIGNWGQIDSEHEGITVISDHHKVSEGSIIGKNKIVQWPRAI